MPIPMTLTDTPLPGYAAQSGPEQAESDPPDKHGRLARARRLGYLKTDSWDAPLVEDYLAWCHEYAKPAVLLYPTRRHLAAITYRMPSFLSVLTRDATDR